VYISSLKIVLKFQYVTKYIFLFVKPNQEELRDNKAVPLMLHKDRFVLSIVYSGEVILFYLIKIVQNLKPA